MEMAKDYPRSEFEGLDVTTSFPNAIKPENCHFTVHNMIDPFPFPANHFEYIHQRLLVLGLLASEWDSVRLQSCQYSHVHSSHLFMTLSSYKDL